MKTILYFFSFSLLLFGCTRNNDPDIDEWRSMQNGSKNTDVIIDLTWEVLKLAEVDEDLFEVRSALYKIKLAQLKEAEIDLNIIIQKTYKRSQQINKIIYHVKETNLAEKYKIVFSINEQLNDICKKAILCIKKIKNNDSYEMDIDQNRVIEKLQKKLKFIKSEIVKKYAIWGPSAQASRRSKLRKLNSGRNQQVPCEK